MRVDDDSLEAFASERSFKPIAPAVVPPPVKSASTVSVGRRTAAAGLVAFGVLPATVFGLYALDWVTRSDRAAQVWSGDAAGSTGGVQRVAFTPPASTQPAATRATSPKTASPARPPRIARTNRPVAPPVEPLPVGLPVGLETIPGPNVIAATEMPSADAGDRGPDLPGLAASTYAEGKRAFEGGEYERARDTFRQVVGIIDSLPGEEQKGLADLRLLASGFVELAGARIPPPAPINRVPSLRAPSVSFVAPVAVQEELPPWMPPSEVAGRSEYAGVLRIRIGVDGRVTGSEVLDASHPLYDAELVRAASHWLYRPATREGRPVPSVKDIQIRLVPR